MATDGKILYGADGGGLRGWRLPDATMVFRDTTILGADGIALGRGCLEGKMVVNTTLGEVWQIDLASHSKTLIATGGSRGDFVAIGPDGSLFLTQTDRIERLKPPPCGTFLRPPGVHVESPNGGESLPVNSPATLRWTAGGDVGIARVDLYLSRNGSGGPFEIIASGEANDGSYLWTVTPPGTNSGALHRFNAFLVAVAHDSAGSVAADTSDAGFEIYDPLSAAAEPSIKVFALAPVRPNPATEVANMEFTVPRRADVRLGVVDIQGREVTRLVDGPREPGRYTIAWSGRTRHGRAGPGVYFVRLQAPGTRIVRRFVLVE